MLRQFTRILLPWIITIVALYFAFRDIDFTTLLDHLQNADLLLLLAAVIATFCSYLLRAYRWEYFFLNPTMHYADAARTLFLGFFMNNILPARAGELVRAHVGAKVAGETRTLVLATIASERLADGLTLSLMFLIFAGGLGDSQLSNNLMYVAAAFGMAALTIILLLISRHSIFRAADHLQSKFPSLKASSYALDRFKIFINGLQPLLKTSKMPGTIGLSSLIWGIELSVYYLISKAFGAELTLPLCVLFMVTVNFSSLIPAAPGGIGVIEAVTTAVLVSIGLDKEQALTMVLAQHAIQYLVVGIPGAIVMLTWKKRYGIDRDAESDAIIKGAGVEKK